jgi:hypothetical protein
MPHGFTHAGVANNRSRSLPRTTLSMCKVLVRAQLSVQCTHAPSGHSRQAHGGSETGSFIGMRPGLEPQNADTLRDRFASYSQCLCRRGGRRRARHRSCCGFGCFLWSQACSVGTANPSRKLEGSNLSPVSTRGRVVRLSSGQTVKPSNRQTVKPSNRPNTAVREDR